MLIAEMPTIMGIKGANFILSMKLNDKTADNPVTKNPAMTHCHLIFKININENIRIIPNPPVISHLFDHILNHNPELLSFTGAPQLAKTKINTNVKK